MNIYEVIDVKFCVRDLTLCNAISKWYLNIFENPNASNRHESFHRSEILYYYIITILLLLLDILNWKSYGDLNIKKAVTTINCFLYHIYHSKQTVLVEVQSVPEATGKNIETFYPSIQNFMSPTNSLQYCGLYGIFYSWLCDALFVTVALVWNHSL